MNKQLYKTITLKGNHRRAPAQDPVVQIPHIRRGKAVRHQSSSSLFRDTDMYLLLVAMLELSLSQMQPIPLGMAMEAMEEAWGEIYADPNPLEQGKTTAW